jgi:hypothetical protein
VRPFPTLARLGLPLIVTGALAAAVAPATAEHGDGSPSSGAQVNSDPFGTPLGFVEGTHKPQTSDRRANPVAPYVPLALRWYGDTSQRQKWTVAPGVHAAVWDQDDARGPNRFYLLSVKYRHRGVHIDTMNNGPVRDVGTVYDMTRRAHGVAGVNGDFYDIGDTGAPLGINRNSSRGLLNGRLSGWNSAFYLDKSGRPEIGRLSVHSVVKQHPNLQITNVNGPSVRPDGIGVYTSRWGWASTRVTDGYTRAVRTVWVRNGHVVRNRPSLPKPGPISGQLLIGRGTGAAQLARLKRGMPVTVTSSLSDSPTMAITGNQFLVDNGLIKVVDDREMAPRTAIGIDRDTHEILILVVDGRQAFSRGMTMVELADEMIDLGADEALNLDGGGSSTFVARRHDALHVVNSPSDGFQRRVANGVVVSYRK